MKKKIILILLFLFIAGTLLVAWAIYISFTDIKPTIDEIDNQLTKYFSKTFAIPEGIPRPSKDLDYIKYRWEMETLEKEVSTVELTFTPAFFSDQKIIVAELQMTENGDPSLFNKVLPAIIVDPVSLKTTQDPTKGDYGPNQQAGYKKLEIETDPKNKQTIKIRWVFEKNKLPSEIEEKYQKLSKYPIPLLKFLHAIPGFLVDLARG